MDPDWTFRSVPGIARLAVLLEVLLGLGAVYGGLLFILAPDGHLLRMTTTMLAGTPFKSYLIPGIILFAFIGLAPLLAATTTLRRQALASTKTTSCGSPLQS
jgi:hypothetical protein